MSEREEKPPVEPKIFLLLERYAKDLQAGQVRTSTEPRSEVVTFCVNFFQQFLHNVAGIEITGINDESKTLIAVPAPSRVTASVSGIPGVSIASVTSSAIETSGST